MTTILAADLPANEWTAVSAAVPFVAAIALFLISPLLTLKVKTAVLYQIDGSARDHRVPEDMIPHPRRRVALDAYLEYAMDAVQIVPLTLLPVTGGVFAIAARVPRPDRSRISEHRDLRGCSRGGLGLGTNRR
jgi:hypothetical protein